MAKGNSRNKRMKPKDSGRRTKKKISPLSSESVAYVDYKDVDLLRRFMSDRAKIRSRRVTGNDSQQQREVARAIKNAREMGLLAYTSRVTTQRRGGRRDDRDGGRRDDRGPRGDRGDRGDRNDRHDRDDDGSDVDETTNVDEVEVENTGVNEAAETVEA